MSKIIGIDLGTTNSVVSVMQGGEPVVIPNQEGARTTPSVVAITKSGERLVGQVAKRQAVTNPENTIYSIKRFMGRRYDEVSEETKRVPYKVVKGPHDDARIEIFDKVYSPPEISAMILGKLKAAAEDFLGEKVQKRSSPCRRTSTTRNGRPPSRPAKLQAWKWSASSMNRLRRRWRTGWTRRAMRRLPSTTLVAARSTFRCWK
jgi:hypothetical protein